MPYPSKGCRTCRQRKIKCDRRRPECGNCEKANRQCLGYALEASGFGFRDEHFSIQTTHRVEAVIRRSPVVTVSPKVTESKPVHPARRTEYPTTPAISVPQDLSQHPQETAMSYYWNTYLNVSVSDRTDEIKSFTRSMIARSLTEDVEPVFLRAVAAESLLIYGRRFHSALCLKYAREQYCRALAEATSSMMDPKRASSDQFLIAVMIFSGYEFKSDPGKDPVSRGAKAEGFKHHIGAMSLLQLRQDMRKQNSNFDIAIDRSVRRQLLRSCILHGYPLPDVLHEASQYGEQDSVLLCLDQYLIEIAELRRNSSSIRAGLASGAPASWSLLVVNALKEMKRAIRIHDDLDNILPLLSERHGYSTIPIEPSNNSDVNIAGLLFNRRLHLYPTYESAYVWSSYRAAQMVCNSIFLALGKHTDSLEHTLFDQAIYVKSKDRLTECVKAVCESVSYHLLSKQTILSLAANSAHLNYDITMASDTSRAHQLNFPLIIAIMSTGLDHKLKLWMKDKLLRIARLSSSSTLEVLAEEDPSN